MLYEVMKMPQEQTKKCTPARYDFETKDMSQQCHSLASEIIINVFYILMLDHVWLASNGHI